MWNYCRFTHSIIFPGHREKKISMYDIEDVKVFHMTKMFSVIIYKKDVGSVLEIVDFSTQSEADLFGYFVKFNAGLVACSSTD